MLEIKTQHCSMMEQADRYVTKPGRGSPIDDRPSPYLMKQEFKVVYK